ncbi:type II and III secretion system protein family protein [Thaumasiovibrio sp. DFM-14]|uniref:type II and III secretion system protein family protein n=1 Tax=Thaumasiovibrio sp. DFM-14 TaxID=3384792 RepID=UPI0039A1A7D3
MSRSIRLSSLGITIIALTLYALCSVTAWAAVSRTENITVPYNKSRLIEIPGRAKKISIGNPDIADILIMRTNKIYVLGKSLGTTNVIIWDAQDRLITVMDVEVTHDINAVKAKLYEFMPNESIAVHTSQSRLVLSGEVSDSNNVSRAVEIAGTFTDDPTNIINMMSVGGSHQVMLEVTVAEVKRSLIREFDSNFILAAADGNWILGAANGGGGAVPVTGEIVSAIPTIEDKGLFASFLSSDTLFNAAFSIAKTNGLAKVLAEPTLTALSGESAEFLSGGEFPIPVPDENGITIVFKEFGVGLSFVPTVLSSDNINLALNVEVSDITTTNSVSFLPGDTETQFFVPALATRNAKTTVELGNGQTIGIAGLLSENITDSVEKLPGLGDIPLLGQLFRSQSFRKGETELVILVTPRLVKPIRKQDVQLPTDAFVEPDDWQYYLLGQMSRLEERDTQSSHAAQATTAPAPAGESGAEGQFGHSL